MAGYQEPERRRRYREVGDWGFDAPEPRLVRAAPAPPDLAPPPAPPRRSPPRRSPPRRVSGPRRSAWRDGEIQFERRPPRGGLPRRQQILLPFVALIALIAGGVGAIALTNEPQTRSLSHQVSTLQSELATARGQLATLQQSVAHAPSARQLTDLTRAVEGLKRTVGGLQSGTVPLQAKVNALTVCVPQLQQELAGAAAASAAASTAKKHTATLTVALSPGCADMLGVG